MKKVNLINQLSEIPKTLLFTSTMIIVMGLMLTVITPILAMMVRLLVKEFHFFYTLF
jgi:uncharacterized membrane protein